MACFDLVAELTVWGTNYVYPFNIIAANGLGNTLNVPTERWSKYLKINCMIILQGTCVYLSLSEFQLK